jgi:hypothetical protein
MTFSLVPHIWNISLQPFIFGGIPGATITSLRWREKLASEQNDDSNAAIVNICLQTILVGVCTSLLSDKARAGAVLAYIAYGAVRGHVRGNRNGALSIDNLVSSVAILTLGAYLATNLPTMLSLLKSS